jgi:hypothetical protein
MQSIRVNTLSYVPWGSITQEFLADRILSAFLAVKHASLAMMKANPERGKPYGGGSIVLVASGKPLPFPTERFPFDDKGLFSCRSPIRSRSHTL